MSEWEDGKEALGCMVQVWAWIGIIAGIGVLIRVSEWAF